MAADHADICTEETSRVMTITSTPPQVLSQPDAVLRVLDTLREANAPAQRLLLEGIAYLARKPEHRDGGCRVLNAFDSHESQDWLLSLHESLVCLEDVDQIRRYEGEYSLTRRGRERASELKTSEQDLADHESRKIQNLAKQVRETLSI